MTLSRRKLRRHRVKVGDVFAIPLEDGYWGAAQVGADSADGYGVLTYVVCEVHFASVEALQGALDETLNLDFAPFARRAA